MIKPRATVQQDSDMGARIRSARVLARLSQEDLGRRLGVSFQQIQKYEKAVNRVSATRLQAIATAVGTTVAFLMNGAETGEAPAEGSNLMTLMCRDSVGRNLAEAFVQIENVTHRNMVAQLARVFANSATGKETA